MLEIHKKIVVDENLKPIAVQIPIDEFERMEEVIENYGLAKLMEEIAALCDNEDEKSRISRKDAKTQREEPCGFAFFVSLWFK